MKRTWQNLIAIAAALAAGIVCSTALAEGGKGGSFRGGSSFRGASSARVSTPRAISGGNLSRTVAPRVTGGVQSGNFQPKLNQNISQGLKRVPVTPANQVRPLPGNLNGSRLPQLGGQKPSGQNLGSQILKGKLPQVGQQVNPAVVGRSPILNSDLVKKINPGIVGKTPVKPGIIPCKPIVDPCHQPHNKWCGPCWWWSPSFCTPSYTGCYYPPVYTYPEPIVIPVATTVVNSTTVVPAAATEPVADEAAEAAAEPAASEPAATEALAVAASEKPMQIPVGALITLQGKELGTDAGQVVVQIDEISLPAMMNEWQNESVQVTLPMLGLASATKANLWMVKADGTVAANIPVELVPAQQPKTEVAAAE